MDYNNVNKRILELCEQRGWSKYKLAQESNICNSAISAMFKNNHVPTFHNLKKICDALQITLSQFFDCSLFADTEKTQSFIHLWRELSPGEQEKVLIYMHGLLHREIQKEDIAHDIR